MPICSMTPRSGKGQFQWVLREIRCLRNGNERPSRSSLGVPWLIAPFNKKCQQINMIAHQKFSETGLRQKPSELVGLLCLRAEPVNPSPPVNYEHVVELSQ